MGEKPSKGVERFGLVASSNAMRLKPVGLNLKIRDPTNWFLNSKDDVRSSYALEDATEFDVQGLELDWVGMLGCKSGEAG